MCKYCKRLKELRDLDEKRYLELIDEWRRHAYKAECIMRRAIDVMDNVCSGEEVCFEDICDMENCVSEMSSWISIDYVGK